jgi:hypothetical protein
MHCSWCWCISCKELQSGLGLVEISDLLSAVFMREQCLG